MAEIGEEHLDPTSEISLETVKSRSVRGVITLTGRTLILNIISVIAQGFLWAYLRDYELGVFWIVSALVNFFVYFSDIGLAAALIQKKEKPSDAELKTTFFIQQALVLLILIILVFISPLLVQKYSLTTDGQILLYALGISLFLSSLKSIPSVLLERKLEFGKLVIPQVLENLIYNIVLVVLAMSGFGIKSFTFAVLIRGIVGLIAIYIVSPWRPGIAFSIHAVKGLLKFGVPYQLNTLLATVKDDGMTILLGTIIGPAGVGILGTAQRLAQYPLRFFMDNVTRVTFPAFARMQGDKGHLERSVTRSIFFITFLVFPSVIGLVILAPILVIVIPRYERWIPALVPLAFVSVNTLFAAVTTQLTNLFNAIGKIRITFFLMIMWTALTWIFVPFLAINYGVNGASVGYAIVGASSIIAIYIAKKYVDFSLIDSVAKPFVATFLMGIVLIILRGSLPYNLYSLWILVSVGVIVYGVLMVAIIGASLIEDAKRSFKTIFNR